MWDCQVICLLVSMVAGHNACHLAVSWRCSKCSVQHQAGQGCPCWAVFGGLPTTTCRRRACVDIIDEGGPSCCMVLVMEASELVRFPKIHVAPQCGMVFRSQFCLASTGLSVFD